eukprot:CAMPEP_0118631818 /NCGR_PEP_ID=MMETSP0785-20121206/110_1 /TAXON_ID=91992 /ORGANISM="Bolidomonas pacifica, Strain CCMP 1866" /LENGTH=131 /DNA_ID=CAMNT_0006522539 /DNA_START=189 /DNA_END=581 /DNA_ORIENTATION=-
MTLSLTHLISGSDIRGEVGTTLTPLIAQEIGSALGGTLQSCSLPTPPTCIIGRDPRVHGEELVNSLARGLAQADVKVSVCTGITTTPSMFYAVTTGHYSSAVMVTASHLPKEKNGFKIFVQNDEYQARCLE